MIRGWIRFLSARGTVTSLALLVTATGVVLAGGVIVFEITIDPTQLPRFTPIWEIIPVLVGTYLPVLLAPRLATWELSGLARLRLRAGVTAVIGALLPALIPWLAHLRLPADARWWDISCNVVFFAAISFLTTAWLGTLVGPTVGLAGYFVAVVIQQMLPAIAAHLPVSGASTNLASHPGAALLALGLAGTVWFATMGQSQLARSMQRNT